MLNDNYKVQPEPLLKDAEDAEAAGRTDGFQFKLLYSREEVAEMLNISLRTLDRLIATKQLPVRRIGKRALITWEVLKQFIRRDHTTGAVQ
jgi:excisionase family DNA binding protein